MVRDLAARLRASGWGGRRYCGLAAGVEPHGPNVWVKVSIWFKRLRMVRAISHPFLLDLSRKQPILPEIYDE